VTRHSDPGTEPAGHQLLAVTQLLPAAAGSVLGQLFGTVALLRRTKPLHPRGVVLDAVVHRTGAPSRWGAAWLDEPGEDDGIARLSRSVGLPRQSPDLMGLALALRGPAGVRHDLLLATTGLGRLTRFVLIPRRDPATACYSCLFPYAAPGGRVVLAAVPVPAAGQQAPAIPRHPSNAPLQFLMLAAAPRGEWHRYGLLRLTAREGAQADPPVSYFALKKGSS
jgi:hypothetical protein